LLPQESRLDKCNKSTHMESTSINVTHNILHQSSKVEYRNQVQTATNFVGLLVHVIFISGVVWIDAESSFRAKFQPKRPVRINLTHDTPYPSSWGDYRNQIRSYKQLRRAMVPFILVSETSFVHPAALWQNRLDKRNFNQRPTWNQPRP
jgi:hypothetical protein